MVGWPMKIPQRLLDWLLEPNQPAIRYSTLMHLLGYSRNSEDVREAYSKIPNVGWAHEILAGQRPRGYWESRENLYSPKYTATIWKLIVLSDFGLTAKDDRIRKPCEFFLNEYAQADGGFDTPGDAPRSELCIVGNLARALLLCGYGEDKRVLAAFDWIVENQMDDGGWHCFPDRAHGRGTLDCWEGLSAFAALPRRKWTRRINRSVERGAEFYLERGLFREGRRRYLPWFRFHYPVHYYYDLLVGLDVITSLGYAGDKRLKAALQILEDKRRPDGTWALDAVHPDLGVGAGYRFKKRPKHFTLEKQGKPSKWITLTALRVLKRVEEANQN